VSERGDLLELFYDAAARPPTLAGRVRSWVHVERQRVAMERDRHQGISYLTHPTTTRRSGPEPPTEYEHTIDLLVAGSGHQFRVDRSAQPDHRLMLTDGSTIWHQVGPGEVIARPVGFPVHMEASELLDPTWLMGYDWGPAERSTNLGRETLVLSVHRRRSPMSLWGGHGPRPSDAEVVIDASLGFLHRVVATDAGEPYRVVEFVELKLDPVVPAGAFSPETAGLKVVDEQAWQRRTRPVLAKRLWRAARRLGQRRRLRRARARAAGTTPERGLPGAVRSAQAPVGEEQPRRAL
jgi:hypothetical protein